MSSELANLPPSIWRDVAEILTRSSGFPAEVAATLRGALLANGKHFVKGEGPGSGWQITPDYRTRLDAIKIILAYAEGMPLQRILEHKIHETRGDLADTLRDSPETLEAVEREVEKAKFRQRKKRVEVVDITPP